MGDDQEPSVTTMPSATVPSNPFTEEFKKHVETTLEAWNCPGMSISVIDDDEIFSEVCHNPFLDDSSNLHGGSVELWPCRPSRHEGHK